MDDIPSRTAATWIHMEGVWGGGRGGRGGREGRRERREGGEGGREERRDGGGGGGGERWLGLAKASASCCKYHLLCSVTSKKPCTDYNYRGTP